MTELNLKWHGEEDIVKAKLVVGGGGFGEIGFVKLLSRKWLDRRDKIGGGDTVDEYDSDGMTRRIFFVPREDSATSDSTARIQIRKRKKEVELSIWDFHVFEEYENQFSILFQLILSFTTAIPFMQNQQKLFIVLLKYGSRFNLLLSSSSSVVVVVLVVVVVVVVVVVLYPPWLICRISNAVEAAIQWISKIILYEKVNLSLHAIIRFTYRNRRSSL
jgi:hypothetical protein